MSLEWQSADKLYMSGCRWKMRFLCSNPGWCSTEDNHTGKVVAVVGSSKNCRWWTKTEISRNIKKFSQHPQRDSPDTTESEVKVAQLCPTLCNPMDYTVHGILQAKILEWVAFPFSRGSSQPRDWTQVSHTASGFFTCWATGEATNAKGKKISGNCLRVR